MTKKIPQWYRITNPRLALLVMALYALANGAVSTYIGSMLTTIEKRFNFNSVEMGAIMGANDIGYLGTVIIVSYLGSRRQRQPIILMLGAVGLWISSLLYVIPYAVYGARYDSHSLLQSSMSAGNGSWGGPRALCDRTNNGSSQHKSIDTTEVSPTEKAVAMTFMMIAGVINGISSTPFWSLGISFLDDMAGELRSGIYIGILFGVRSFAPIIGFLIGSVMTTISEDLKTNVDKYLPGQRDSKWIGAWWLGWMILGFCVLFPGAVMGLLKAKKPLADEQIDEDLKTDMLTIPDKDNEFSDVQDDQISETFLSSIKEIYAVFCEALKNKVYVLLVTGVVFDIMGNIILYVFFTKYLEYHFRASAKLTNILAAICLSGSRLLSSLFSGIISKVCPMNIRGMNRFVALTNTISGLMFPFLLIFKCPSTKIFGLSDNTSSTMCSFSCGCQIKKLAPVCFNATTYFSACIIGCVKKVNETFFSDCGCDGSIMAEKGFCETMCTNIYYFLAAFFIIKMINSICSVQFMTLFLRLCDPRDKAIYLSSIGFLFSICGLSFPPIAGIVIDSACIFRDTDSYGGKSNCLIYDNDRLRYLIIGVSFIFQLAASFIYIASWLVTPKDYKYRRPSMISHKNSMPTEIELSYRPEKQPS